MRFGKLIVPDNAKGLGANADAKKALEMANDWRYWVSPRTVDKWAETKAGHKTLDVLAKSGSESEIMDILGQMPTHVQRNVRNVNRPDQVLSVIRPHLGVKDPLAPTGSLADERLLVHESSGHGVTSIPAREPLVVTRSTIRKLG